MNITKKTVKGIGWAGTSQVVRQVFMIVITAILARLLTPKDFGLIAMIIVFSNFINVFKDFGLTYALIQKKDVTLEELSTSFWMNIGMGLILSLVLFLVSRPIALFYNEPKLIPVTRFFSLTFFISSVGIIHSTLLNKEMKFKVLSTIEMSTTILAGISAVFMALSGFGIWALVYQQVIYCILFSIFVWIAVDWRPEFIFRWGNIKQFLGFGMNLTGFNFVNYFSRNLDNLLIGKIFGPALLGFYDLAYKLLTLPIQQISAVIGKVMFPAFSIIQDDKTAVRKGYLKGIKYISLVSFPLMIGLLIIAPEFVLAVFGPLWKRSIFLIQVFALIGLLQSVISTTGWIYTSQGRTNIMFRWGIVSMLVGIPLLIIGLKWSIEGVAVAYAIATLLLIYPGFIIPFRLIDLKMNEFLFQFKETLLFSFIMGSAVFSLRLFLKYLAVNNLTILVSCIIFGSAFYIILLILFAKSFCQEFVRIFKKAI